MQCLCCDQCSFDVFGRESRTSTWQPQRQCSTCHRTWHRNCCGTPGLAIPYQQATMPSSQPCGPLPPSNAVAVRQSGHAVPSRRNRIQPQSPAPGRPHPRNTCLRCIVFSSPTPSPTPHSPSAESGMCPCCHAAHPDWLTHLRARWGREAATTTRCTHAHPARSPRTGAGCLLRTPAQ